MNPEFKLSVNTNVLFGTFCLLVKDCVPDIDDLEPMVQELNKSDNFSKFVISMRKKFKGTL